MVAEMLMSRCVWAQMGVLGGYGVSEVSDAYLSQATGGLRWVSSEADHTVDYQNYVIKMGGADNFVPTYDAYKMFVQELKK